MPVPARSKLVQRDRDQGREALESRFARGERTLFVPLAELARRDGRLAEAAALLEQGLEECPRRVSAWVQLARLRAQEGRMDEALRHYRHVLEALDPQNLPALRALTASSLAAGDVDAARRLLEAWSAQDPEDPELADLLEELEAMGAADPSPPVPRAPGLMELSLAELEPAYLRAPSPDDPDAWAGADPQRAGGERTG
ncbi:MAG: tetratricopeptide repeat protein [Candidatus Krumholzibacteriia bacterium]|nr:tetratricopeptide repeat protein [Candidatus Latescibacterota bacterium]